MYTAVGITHAGESINKSEFCLNGNNKNQMIQQNSQNHRTNFVNHFLVFRKLHMSFYPYFFEHAPNGWHYPRRAYEPVQKLRTWRGVGFTLCWAVLFSPAAVVFLYGERVVRDCLSTMLAFAEIYVCAFFAMWTFYIYCHDIFLF